MAVARINLKSIDYFKFKKLVIDGNRDDYGSCSKEVKALCDCVQTLNFRDEQFDDESDRERFEQICVYYREILQSKRIESLDMRIKSGWWGDHKNAYSAGKIKPGALRDTLVAKARQWGERHGGVGTGSEATLSAKLDGPGLYVFKHRDHQCFQFVARADKIFTRVGERLKAAFEGSLQEPLAALLVISMVNDWDFYFTPVSANDDERVPRVLENDLILKHDCIWPHGLNFRLHIDSLLEVSEFRKSCLRHNWPPDSDGVDPEIDLGRLRHQISAQPQESREQSDGPLPPRPSSAAGKPEAKPEPKSEPKPEPKPQPKHNAPKKTQPSARAPQPSADKKPETPRHESKASSKPASATRRNQVTTRPASPITTVTTADSPAKAKPEPRTSAKTARRPTGQGTATGSPSKSGAKPPAKKLPPRSTSPVDVLLDVAWTSDSESPDSKASDLGENANSKASDPGERPSSSLSGGTYVLDSDSDTENPTTRIPVISDSEGPVSPSHKPRPMSAGPKKSGAKTTTDSRPKSAMASPRKYKSGSTAKSPQTPNGLPKGAPSPKVSPGEATPPKLSPEEATTMTTSDEVVPEPDPEPVNLGEFEHVIVRSVSGSSLTSLTLQSDFDENSALDTHDMQPDSPRVRPASGKSRLPVAATGPLRHQNRE